MSTKTRKIVINVAWPYANGPRHIGHVAGFGVPSDIFARYHRLKGNQVLMVSGTDEHGTPITVQAEQEGISPQELTDRYNAIIGEDLRRLGLSYDLFTRTTTRNHARVTQDIFRTLRQRGYIIQKESLGAFDPKSGRTLPDRYIEGRCPHCQQDGARGDQCDHCGKQLEPTELIEPRSKIDGARPVFRNSKHFFLDLPRFVAPLREWILQKSYWRPNVGNFSLQLLKDLEPRPITRDLDWGVPIPPNKDDRAGDREGDAAEDAVGDEHLTKRIYVWFDAVIGYLSASVEWAQLQDDPDAWRCWWQDPEAKHYYFMGKDNIVFHSIIWPSMLIGYGNGELGSLGDARGSSLQLPYDIVASEFLTMEGRKFSSSRGVVIYVADFLDRYDPDALRYFLTAAGPEQQDTDFTWAEFLRRNNDELVANWGNLVSRTLALAKKHFGRVPQPSYPLTTQDEELLKTIEEGFTGVGLFLEHCAFRNAIQLVMTLATHVNRYLNDQEPWQLVKTDSKTDSQRAATVLFVALQAIDWLKVLFAPFLPFSSARLHLMLGYQDENPGKSAAADLCGSLFFRHVAEEPITGEPVAGESAAEESSPERGPSRARWATEEEIANPKAKTHYHRVLSSDYRSMHGRWRPSTLPAGQALGEVRPLFRKLDPDIVEHELQRMAHPTKTEGSG